MIITVILLIDRWNYQLIFLVLSEGPCLTILADVSSVIYLFIYLFIYDHVWPCFDMFPEHDWPC